MGRLLPSYPARLNLSCVSSPAQTGFDLPSAPVENTGTPQLRISACGVTSVVSQTALHNPARGWHINQYGPTAFLSAFQLTAAVITVPSTPEPQSEL